MALQVRELLGEDCPFGRDSSAKHMSLEENCPDLRIASGADRQIAQALRDFQGFVGERPPRWRPCQLDAFDDIGREAKSIHDSAPASLSEFFPLDAGRNAEALLDRVAEGGTIMARAILTAHSHAELRFKSHRLSARAVMAAIGRNWDTIACEDGVGELQLAVFLEGLAARRNPDHSWRAPSAFGSERGIALSASTLRTLVAYQTVQERLATAAAVDRLNAVLADRTKVLEDLLGILLAIVADLQRWIDADPARLALARAFSEIGLVDTSGRIVPNSRFLKIVVHNWGEFIADCPVEPIGRIVGYCAARARLNLIYEQNILVLRREETVRKLYGIAVRACPAAAVIGPLVSYYANLDGE